MLRKADKAAGFNLHGLGRASRLSVSTKQHDEPGGADKLTPPRGLRGALVMSAGHSQAVTLWGRPRSRRWQQNFTPN